MTHLTANVSPEASATESDRMQTITHCVKNTMEVLAVALDHIEPQLTEAQAKFVESAMIGNADGISQHYEREIQRLHESRSVLLNVLELTTAGDFEGARIAMEALKL